MKKNERQGYEKERGTMTNPNEQSEWRYQITFTRPGTRELIGISVTACGDRRGNVIESAGIILESALEKAQEASEKYPVPDSVGKKTTDKKG